MDCDANQKAIMRWLLSDKQTLEILENQSQQIFIKITKNDIVDFIYAQRSSCLKTGSDLEYMGIYNKPNKTLYDIQFMLSYTMYGHCRETATDRKSVITDFENEVILRVEHKIANNTKNLMIHNESDIVDSQCKRQLKNAREYGIRQQVRELFLTRKTPQDVIFKCDYGSECFTDDEFIRCINSKESMVNDKVDKYIKENQQNILTQMLINDIIRAKLQMLIDDTENDLHKLKNIMQAMMDNDYVTVNVTTLIDHKELTFKTEASELRSDCEYHYSTYRITASDRRKYEDTYGRNADYTPKDIIQITHGKNILYETIKKEDLSWQRKQKL